MLSRLRARTGWGGGWVASRRSPLRIGPFLWRLGSTRPFDSAPSFQCRETAPDMSRRLTRADECSHDSAADLAGQHGIDARIGEFVNARRLDPDVHEAGVGE